MYQFSFHLLVSVTLKCGRVVGYQFGSADAVDPTIGDPNAHNDINSYYVDGVSIILMGLPVNMSGH